MRSLCSKNLFRCSVKQKANPIPHLVQKKKKQKLRGTVKSNEKQNRRAREIFSHCGTDALEYRGCAVGNCRFTTTMG